MGKITLVFILAIIIIVLVAAIKGKSVMEILATIKKRGVKTPPDRSHIIDQDNEFEVGCGGFDVTFVPPVLYMHQLNKDGSTFFKHGITLKQMHNEDDEMVGVSVSHPGASSDGIILYGKKNRDGVFNRRDESTLAAMTVNTNAVIIGLDDKGFYAEVTNPKAAVYTVDDKAKSVRVPFGQTFDIVDKTYVLIGTQWLYFTVPKLPDCPGFSNSNIDPSQKSDVTVPNFVDKAKKGIVQRVANPVKKTVGKESFVTSKAPTKSVEKDKKITYRFPLDED